MDAPEESISRRTLLALGGGVLGSAAFGLAGCGSAGSGPTATIAAAGAGPTGACVLVAEQEEGPYYVPNSLIRSHITEGRSGVPLKLEVTVVDATASCAPVAGAAVDIWHCDAAGAYSDGDEAFLRGVQVTGDDGRATFTTIFPGWYPGRAVHIHLKVHVGGAVEGNTYSGGHVSHTGQLFPPEDAVAAVMALAPYAEHTGTRTTLADDEVYNGQGGAAATLTLTPATEGNPVGGYTATVTLGVSPTSTPSPAGR